MDVCTGSNTELYDCGSIYTLSSQPGSEVSHNYIVNQVLLYGVSPSPSTRFICLNKLMTAVCWRGRACAFCSHRALGWQSLYHDARSGFFHTHHNVVVGGPMWLYLQVRRSLPFALCSFKAVF